MSLRVWSATVSIPPGAEGTVVEQVGCGLDLVLYGQEYQLGHQFHGVPGRPVLSGFFIVVLVEPCESGPRRWSPWHGCPGRGSVPFHRGFSSGLGLKLTVGDRNLSIRLPSTPPVDNLFTWLRNSELVQNVLDVVGESVQVCLEVLPELLLGRRSCQGPQGELRRVVELLTGGLGQWTDLVNDVCLVEPFLLFQDGVFGGLQDGVKPADDGHGKYHVPVLAPDVEVPKNGVGDVPDEVGDGGELAVLQFHTPFFGLKLILHERGVGAVFSGAAEVLPCYCPSRHTSGDNSYFLCKAV